ncbi:MAG: hypothetical protein ACRDFB_09480 [Rhabdochlamydiaceae bacterium]
MANISIEWIENYVDTLLKVGEKMESGPFKDAVLLRATHALDMLDAWKNKDNEKL